jgi:drug/metabolite transporter (DMT)-like permease
VAVGFAILAAALFGLLAVALRTALRRQPSPDAGIAATGLIGLVVAAIVAAASGLGSDDFALHDLWPFLATGAVVPGLSQLLLIRAVRDAGPSRTSVVIGTAPVISALLAITLLDEPLQAGLAVATVLIVSGGFVLAREQERPHDFRLVGLAFALGCAWLFAGRDNVVRWAATDADPNPLVAAAASLAAASALTLAVALSRGHARQLVRSFRPFFVAGLSLGLAYSSLLVAFDRGRVVVVAPLNATQSLFAVAIAALVFKRAEMIGPRLLVAALLIVAGGALVGATR